MESQCYLICTSFTVKDVEHFFICLLAVRISFWRIVCPVHLPIYSVLIFERLVFWIPCIFWWLIFCQLFSNSVHCLSSLMTVFFAELCLSILSLNCWTIGALLIRLLSIPIKPSVFPFFLDYFTISDLTLRSSIYFELMLVQCERLGSNFSLLQGGNQFFLTTIISCLWFFHY
jgi:hypothetical protein